MGESANSFDTRATLTVNGRTYCYYAVNGGELSGHDSVARLPASSKILLENLLRHEDGISCSREDMASLPPMPVAVPGSAEKGATPERGIYAGSARRLWCPSTCRNG